MPDDNGASGANEAALTRTIENLLAKYSGDPRAIADLHARERERKDDEIRRLKRQIRQEREKRAPEGAVVLTGDDAKAWEAYRALGTPDEVTAKLGEATTATERLAALEREVATSKVASAVGYKPSVLADLAKSKGFAVELRQETVDGKPQEVPYAITSDGQAVKLTDYVSQNLADYLPALTSGTSTGGGQQQRTTPAAGTAGPRYPSQAGGSSAPQAGSVFDRVREQAKAEREQAKAGSAQAVNERLGLLTA